MALPRPRMTIFPLRTTRLAMSTRTTFRFRRDRWQ
jgi:hypothetical protein